MPPSRLLQRENPHGAHAEDTSCPATTALHVDAQPAPSQQDRVHTAAILILALVLRLWVLYVVYTQYAANWFFTRGLEMGLLAKSLSSGQGLSSPFGPPTGPTAYFAPAYPVFVAGVFRLFGAYTLASSIVIIVAQILLNLITVWLVMQVARQFFNPRTANIAGTIWAISLPLLWLPTIFWETCLSTCILIGIFPLALNCSRTPTMLRWIAMGSYLGLTALINPALLPAMACVFVWTIYQTRYTPTQKLAPALALLTAAVIFAPWPIRNAHAFHTFIPTRSNMGSELWIGNHPGASGYLEESLFPSFNQAELADYQAHGEIAYNVNKSAITKQSIQTHSAEFLRLTTLRIFRFWTGSGNQRGSILLPIHCVLTTFFGLIGLGMLFRKRAYASTILFSIPLTLFPLPYYITHAEFRFRIVIDPILTVLAAYAISQLLHKPHHAVLEVQPADQPVTNEVLVSA